MKYFKYDYLTEQAQLTARLEMFDMLRDDGMFDASKSFTIDISGLIKCCQLWEFESNGEIVND